MTENAARDVSLSGFLWTAAEIEDRMNAEYGDTDNSGDALFAAVGKVADGWKSLRHAASIVEHLERAAALEAQDEAAKRAESGNTSSEANSEQGGSTPPMSTIPEKPDFWTGSKCGTIVNKLGRFHWSYNGKCVCRMRPARWVKETATPTEEPKP